MNDRPAVTPKTSGMAIASLIMAFILAPIGVILGIVSLIQIGRSEDELKGSGLAIAGLVIGGIGTFVLIPITAAILFPVFARARTAAQSTACLDNIKQINVGVQMYAQDNNSMYPPAASWNDAIKTYVKNPKILSCPVDKSGKPSYAMNDQLSGIAEKDIQSPADTVMIFESEPGINRSGGAGLVLQESRHGDLGNAYGFADGHVKKMVNGTTANLLWSPAALLSPDSAPCPPSSGG